MLDQTLVIGDTIELSAVSWVNELIHTVNGVLECTVGDTFKVKKFLTGVDGKPTAIITTNDLPWINDGSLQKVS
jgi:hypothetical protein